MASLFGNAVFDISSAIWILGCVVLDLGAGETVAMALPLEWHGVRRWVEQPFAAMSGLSPATAGSSYYIMRTVWQMMAFVYTLLTVLCWATPLEEFVDSVAPVEEAAADAKHLKRELWQLTPRDRKRRDLKNQRKISRAVQSLLPTQQPANGASGAPDARMRAKEERRRQEEARREYKERAKREKIEAKERLREAKEEQKAQQRMLREEEEARRAQEEKVQRRMRAVSNWEKFVVSLFAKDKQRRQRKAAQQKLKKQNVELYCEMGCSATLPKRELPRTRFFPCPHPSCNGGIYHVEPVLVGRAPPTEAELEVLRTAYALHKQEREQQKLREEARRSEMARKPANHSRSTVPVHCSPPRPRLERPYQYSVRRLEHNQTPASSEDETPSNSGGSDEEACGLSVVDAASKGKTPKYPLSPAASGISDPSDHGLSDNDDSPDNDDSDGAATEEPDDEWSSLMKSMGWQKGEDEDSEDEEGFLTPDEIREAQELLKRARRVP